VEVVTMGGNEDWLARRFNISAEHITPVWLAQARLETQALLEENDRLRDSATQMANKLAAQNGRNVAAGGHEEKCGNCRFWRNPHPAAPRSEAMVANCCRNAPAAKIPGRSSPCSTMTIWPQTLDSEWCGAWAEVVTR
jgi:hypothetical protein